MTAADDTDESREATRGYIDVFLDATGWNPRKAATLATQPVARGSQDQ